ncbi:DUF1285 domain-containing protein [Alteromonas sp. ASW11-130]|uniref:DUF1285 domain-containing protein n=1 Tax=Alteromonas sp. ASW11-130 TaxID=3015775 RepID=UPI0022420AA2|nr:DUF1285 domain-containing protein [Alteromonas sp. ASW11-130]MCW8093375.1 DUF1285 domain-containing protein [Alteromonas sp. ASW11-130]
MDLNKLQTQITGHQDDGLPPVEKWDPPFCGDLNMQIKLDGRWFYENSPIGRLALVRLFSSVLKKEGERYFLVTPVEKVGLSVEDVPFLITQWKEENGVYQFTTQTGDELPLNENHPIELRQPPTALSDPQATPIPYIKVRRNLWARFNQNVYYQLIERAQPKQANDGTTSLQLTSQGQTYCIGKLPSNLA